MFAEQLTAECKMTAELRGRYDRQTVADYRIVCVVPFGSAGVHPYSAAEYEIREPSRYRNAQLLRECRRIRPAADAQQTVVSAELGRLCAQTAVLLRVELNCILRVGYHAVKVGYTVRNIRIGKAV